MGKGVHEASIVISDHCEPLPAGVVERMCDPCRPEDSDKAIPTCGACGQRLRHFGTLFGTPIYGHCALEECKEKGDV